MNNIVKNILKRVGNLLPDELFIKAKYKHTVGERLDLYSPKTFNEKLQWLKLNDRRPEYNNYVDKLEVRKHIENTIGKKHLIPLLGVYDKVEDINWDELPEQFVLKCTHGCGCNIICKDKSKLDIGQATKQLNKWMKKNWFWYGREWPYKDLQPRIICEKFMVDESGKELKDYKVFCFNGEPKIIQVDYDRFIEHKRNLYTVDWKLVNATIQYPNDPNVEIVKPQKLNEMLNYSSVLSQGIPHVRVDFYSIEGNIYFGEMTFYHGSGYEKFEPKEFSNQMGSWIKLGV